MAAGDLVIADTGEYARATSGLGVLPLADTSDQARLTTGLGVLPFVNTQDTPLSFSLTGSGGVGVGGGADIQGDPFFPTGGMQVTGEATVGGFSVMILDFYPLGGTQVTGAATVTDSWNIFVPTGGIKLTGAATNSYVASPNPYPNPVITVVLPALFAELSDLSTTGTISATLPAIHAGIGVAQGQGVAATLPSMSAVITAGSNALAEIDVALTPLSVEIEGGQFEFEATLPALTCEVTGTTSILAEIDAQLPWIDAEFSCIAAVMGGIAATVPRMRASVSGLAGQVATIDATLRRPTTSINALLGTSATLDAALTVIEVNTGALQQVSASISVVLPSFEFSASAYMPVTQVATYVVDTLTSAVSTYEAFPFNSFAEIDGRFYGAGPTGMFELVGDKDNSSGSITDVDAVVATGHLHFGSEMQKRMSDFFVAMRADGDITLRVSVDENDPFEYTLSPLDIETLKQRRSLIGKGAKGKYWKFELSNTDGCDFDFDSFNAAAVVLSRRL